MITLRNSFDIEGVIILEVCWWVDNSRVLVKLFQKEKEIEYKNPLNERLSSTWFKGNTAYQNFVLYWISYIEGAWSWAQKRLGQNTRGPELAFVIVRVSVQGATNYKEQLSKVS